MFGRHSVQFRFAVLIDAAYFAYFFFELFELYSQVCDGPFSDFSPLYDVVSPHEVDRCKLLT